MGLGFIHAIVSTMASDASLEDSSVPAVEERDTILLL